MSDVYTPPPVAGTDPWDSNLNTTIDWLHRHVATLETKVAALEARPEYVFNSYFWSFNAGTPPAASAQVRMNNSNPALATLLDFYRMDYDGADRTPIFQHMPAESQIRINDYDDAALIHRFRVTGPTTLSANNAQVPVAWISGNGNLPTQGQAKVTVAFLVALSV